MMNSEPKTTAACKAWKLLNKHSECVDTGTAPTRPPFKKTESDKKVTSYVNDLKECTRSCLMHFSTHYQLPPELDRLLSALNGARTVAIKLSPKQPKFEQAERLEKLLSEAFSLARKFHGVQVCNDVFARVSRVKRHLAPGARMARGLVKALEDTSDSEMFNEDLSGVSLSKTQSDITHEGTLSTEELAKEMNTSLCSVTYEHSKSMCHISEQLSRSSMCTSASTDPEDVKIAQPVVTSSASKELNDGPVKFILCSSPLTAVLEQRKKNGQSLMSPTILNSNSTSQTETVKDRKTVNPIKESRLTALVKDEDSILYYAKIFAEKIHKILSSQQKAASHSPLVEQNKAARENRMVTPIKESRLTALVEKKDVVQYYAEIFAEKMQKLVSSQLKSVSPLPKALAEHTGRVILSAKRTKKVMSVKINLSSVTISHQANTITDESLSSGHRTNCIASMTKSLSEEAATRPILGKRSSTMVDLPKTKAVKQA